MHRMHKTWVVRALIAAVALSVLWWWPVPHVPTGVGVEKPPYRK